MVLLLRLAPVYCSVAYTYTCMLVYVLYSTCGFLAGHYSPSLRQRWANLLTARLHVHLASVPVLLLNRNHVLRVVTCGVHAGFLAMRGAPFRLPRCTALALVVLVAGPVLFPYSQSLRCCLRESYTPLSVEAQAFLNVGRTCLLPFRYWEFFGLSYTRNERKHTYVLPLRTNMYKHHITCTLMYMYKHVHVTCT